MVHTCSSIGLLSLPHLRTAAVVAEVVVVVAGWHAVSSGCSWSWPVHRVGEVGGCRLVVWAVGNEVPGLTAVEACPWVVGGGDLAGVVLWGLHGILVVVLLELGFRALGARCL